MLDKTEKGNLSRYRWPETKSQVHAWVALQAAASKNLFEKRKKNGSTKSGVRKTCPSALPAPKVDSGHWPADRGFFFEYLDVSV
eukprot:m.1638357 g.1638357  ORF g.1638357 m.1638357 type:complete len:84 (-) comp27759_c0_seq1:1765-2016(-)